DLPVEPEAATVAGEIALEPGTVVVVPVFELIVAELFQGLLLALEPEQVVVVRGACEYLGPERIGRRRGGVRGCRGEHACGDGRGGNHRRDGCLLQGSLAYSPSASGAAPRIVLPRP